MAVPPIAVDLRPYFQHLLDRTDHTIVEVASNSPDSYIQQLYGRRYLLIELLAAAAPPQTPASETPRA